MSDEKAGHTHRQHYRNRAGSVLPELPAGGGSDHQLEQLGYRLVFQLSAQPERDHLPELPAQYHYRHASGAEAIFLAGRDSPLHSGVLSLPCHASRFWLSRGGRDDGAFQLTMATLACRWRFQWQEVHEDVEEADEAEEVA